MAADTLTLAGIIVATIIAAVLIRGIASNLANQPRNRVSANHEGETT